MGQVHTLVHYRLLRIRNRAREYRLSVWAGSLLAGLCVLLAAGFALSPDRFEPLEARAGVVHWGGWSYETAFYIACLIAAMQSYRLMEGLFRQPETKILATYPIDLPGLFFYRLGVAALDTLLWAFLGAVFLLPVWIKGGGEYYAWSVILLVLSALFIVVLGFAAQMAMGVADYKHMPEFLGELDRQGGGTGGGAAAYLFSPAVALAASLFCILFSKLSLEEVIKAGHAGMSPGTPGIVSFAAVVVVVVLVGGLVWAYRNFTRYYPKLFARFFESDLIVLDVGFDYFARDKRPARGWEAFLSWPIRSLYRLDRLQLARRSPLDRILVWMGPLAGLAAFLAVGHRLQPWMAMCIGLIWLLVLTNPYSRLYHPDMDPGQGAVLPITPQVRQRARNYLVIREVLLFSVPLALAGLVLPDWESRIGLWLVPLIAMAAHPFITAVAAQAHQVPRLIGILLATAFAGLAVAHSLVPVAATVVLAAIGLAWARKAGDTSRLTATATATATATSTATARARATGESPSHSEVNRIEQ